MQMMTTENALLRVDETLAVTRWDAGICAEIRSAYHAAAAHSLFSELTTPERLALFMGKHAWAVWDFTCLMKSVQSVLAPSGSPWIPPHDRRLAGMINEIVLEQESGFRLDGLPVSHFDYYLYAMREAGADTQQIDGFILALRDGLAWHDCLERFAPAPAARFVRVTMELAAASPAERVAAFAVGREQLIPEMFPVLSVGMFAPRQGQNLAPMRDYLDQHAAIDGDAQVPATLHMLEVWAGDDPAAARAALRAVQARVDLWDHTLSAVSSLPAAG